MGDTNESYITTKIFLSTMIGIATLLFGAIYQFVEVKNEKALGIQAIMVDAVREQANDIAELQTLCHEQAIEIQQLKERFDRQIARTEN